MFVAFDVNPAVKRFVVVTAFPVYRLPVTLIVLVAFAMVRVFAKTFVVVTELLTTRFDKVPTDVMFG